MNLELVDQIAKAVLYEGYMLYPYRPSSVKNRQRWNFGVLYPPAYACQQVGSDTSTFEAECLLETGSQAELDVRIRFLQLSQRNIAALKHPVRELPSNAMPEMQMVDTLTVNGKSLQSWQEAIEREVIIHVGGLEALPSSHPFEFTLEASSEPVLDENGDVAALIQRSGNLVSGTIAISAERLDNGALKLRLALQNTSPFEGSTREDALLASMVSAHLVLGVRNGAFVSLLDMPEPLREAAAGCRNIGVWPVLVGEEGQRDTLLVSPIILYDYPQIAPESAGDLFDGTEIDEILSLRIMTLTDDEKREMRESDDRARQILERTETLPAEQLMKLHGVLRGLRPVKEERP